MVAEIPSGTAHSVQQEETEEAEENAAILRRPKTELQCAPEASTSQQQQQPTYSGGTAINQSDIGSGGGGGENGCGGGHQLKREEDLNLNLNHLNLELCLCTSCGLPIHDQYLYKVLDQQFYHEKCLCCSVCGEPFRGGTCFSRNGALFCRDHFVATFGPKCARCAAPIGERTIVRRANQHIYHLDCFQCVVCKRELNTGDQFYLIPMDGRLICRQDFENAQKESADMDCGNKRPRTTISAKSLETLKQAYQCSSKPARHVREQLANQTGLEMRVVQVWFQNRRAKEKRLKKDANRRWAAGQHAGQSGGGPEGGPRSASDGTTGGNGSGPGSVPSSSGMHGGSGMLYGRTGTLDSDSGMSNNDAESPIYTYSHFDSSEDPAGDAVVDMPQNMGRHQNSSGAAASNECYPDGDGLGGGVGYLQPAVTTASESMGAGPGTPSMSVLITSMAAGIQQEQMSPHHHHHHHLHHQSSPLQSQQQQQLYTLEQLNGAGPRTPLAGTTVTAANQIVPLGLSQPGTPQHQQPPQMPQNGGPPLFSPGQMIFPPQLSDQQQQYLLAAASLGPPPPSQMGQQQMGGGHFMPGPPGVPPEAAAAFYAHHPAAAPLGHHHPSMVDHGPHNMHHHHHPFSALAMHPGAMHYAAVNAQGQQISQ